MHRDFPKSYFSFHTTRHLHQNTQFNFCHQESTGLDFTLRQESNPDGKVYNSAFRSFGGGNNICPGRHFAQTEVLGLVALFVAGFEIKNAGGGGEYERPPYEDFKLMMAVIKPGKDVDVMISRRKGYENVEWAFEV